MADFGPFRDVRDEDIEAINTVAAFLAEDDHGDAADVVVLAGNAMLWTLEGAVARAGALDVPLLISGGIGHSTALLQDVVAAHPVYRNAPQGVGSEASLLGEIAVHCLGFPGMRIIAEGQSTNCAENAVFSRRVLDVVGLRPARLLLIQDPLMQRRTAASFRTAWGGKTDIVNWPVWVPEIAATGAAIQFRDPPGGRLWSVQRFMELLLGEIPRLRDDEAGYGPRGRGFIPHVDIPEPVEAAHRHLIACGRFSGAATRLPVHQTPGRSR
jgi:uncharacterized SAM-binding protein YcdF (DUF218 family)